MRWAAFFAFSVYALLFALITGQSTGLVEAVSLIERVIGAVCHHDPARSFPNASVCARCTGLYIGWLMALGPGISAWRRGLSVRALSRLAGAFGAAVILASAERLHWMAASNPWRLLFGIPLGLFPGAVLLIGATLLLGNSPRSRRFVTVNARSQS